jgi:hypothetical protein
MEKGTGVHAVGIHGRRDEAALGPGHRVQAMALVDGGDELVFCDGEAFHLFLDGARVRRENIPVLLVVVQPAGPVKKGKNSARGMA